jgi:hypothetical protein
MIGICWTPELHSLTLSSSVASADKLFCMPENLALTIEQAESIMEDWAKRRTNIDQMLVATALFAGLGFPVPNSCHSSEGLPCATDARIARLRRFIRSGISIRSFHAKLLPFYHVIPHTPRLQSTWG